GENLRKVIALFYFQYKLFYKKSEIQPIKSTSLSIKIKNLHYRLFHLPALISSIYITVMVALYKVDLTYPISSGDAIDKVQDHGLHHNFSGDR
ncbi:TPA: hypothetical protein ACNGYJ_005496, partial [Klebsiella quasipneumoniae subsp. quasipneumoniae]